MNKVNKVNKVNKAREGEQGDRGDQGEQRNIRTLFTLLTFLTFFLFPRACGALEAGGNTILEVSNKISNDLRDKIQRHLDRVLGHGRSEVFVEVDVDFSREVKGNLDKMFQAYLDRQTKTLPAPAPAAPAAAPAVRQNQFPLFPSWFTNEQKNFYADIILHFMETFMGGENQGQSSVAGQSAESDSYPKTDQEVEASLGLSTGTVDSRQANALNRALPPGLSYDDFLTASAGLDPQDSQHAERRPQAAFLQSADAGPFGDPNFLYSIGLEIKRIYVRILLDEALPRDSDIKVRALVESLIDFNAARGDRLVMSRFQLPDPVRELFKDSKFLGVLIEWGVVAVLALFGLLMASFLAFVTLRGLFNLLGQWMGALLAARNRSVELKLEAPNWLKEALPQLLGRGEFTPAGSAGSVVEVEAQSGQAAGLTIEVPVEKTVELLGLIGNENPANIALVVAKLSPAAKSAFLAMLAPERLAVVLEALANPKYIDPVVLRRLKETLERRLGGMVGGETEVLRTIESSEPAVRSRLLQTLETQNAALFRAVRRKIFLFNDLLYLKDHELKVLLSQVSVQVLSLAIANGITPKEVKEKIISSLPKKTADTVNDHLAAQAKPPREKILEAQERIIETAQRMIAEGAIGHPMAGMAPGER